MTTRGRAQRLDRLEALILKPPQCQTCWDTGSFIVAVPRQELKNDPEYRPDGCPECGRTGGRVTQIVGFTDEELFGPDGPLYRPERAG